MKICVAIPCFNEHSTIANVISDVRSALQDFNPIIVVIDDGSSDGTAAEAKYSGAHVVSHEKNHGLGYSFRTAVDFALKNDFNVLCTIDGDGQFNAEDLTRLLHLLIAQNLDFATGTRFAKNHRPPSGMPKLNFYGNKCVAFLVRQLTHLQLSDVACGLRVYSRKALEKFNLVSDFTYTQETILNLASHDMKSSEMPIEAKYFKNRKSRIAGSLIKYARHTLPVFLRNVKI